MRSLGAALLAAFLLALALGSRLEGDPAPVDTMTAIDVDRNARQRTQPNSARGRSRRRPRSTAESIDLGRRLACLSAGRGRRLGSRRRRDVLRPRRRAPGDNRQRPRQHGRRHAGPACARAARRRSTARYAKQVRKGLEFVLRHVERSEPQGLALKQPFKARRSSASSAPTSTRS